MSNNTLQEPLYFHRDYANDLPKQEAKAADSSQALRVVKVALPFIALYQPFGKVLAGGFGVTRSVTAFSNCLSAQDYKQLSWALFNTCLAVGSVAGTIILHPLGMMINTLNDIGVNIYHVYGAISQGEMKQAAKDSVRVANNALYLGMLIVGSVELQLASLAIQVLVEGGTSYEEFDRGNILEMVGHLAMCAVRANQSYTQFGALQRKWQVEAISKRSVVNIPKPVEGSTGKASSLEVACMKNGKWHPALNALKEQHQGHLVYADLKVKDDHEICLLSDEIDFNLLPEVKAVGDNGDLVAVWLDADASGISKDGLSDFDTIENHFAGLDKALFISQYNAVSGNWSVPNGLAVPKEEINWSFMSADRSGNALILLENANALEAITFDHIANQWLSPVILASHLPEAKAFDGDALGNCTIAWSDEESLFTVRSYDAINKTWTPGASIKSDMPYLQNGQTDRLLVRRDLENNIAIFGEADEVPYGSMFNGKTGLWSTPKGLNLNEDEQIVELVSMGDGRFTGIFTDDEIIRSLLLDAKNKNSDWENFIQINDSKGDIDKIIVEKDLYGHPVVAWIQSRDESEVMDEWLESLDFDRSMESISLEDLFQHIFDSTQIQVANFDPVEGRWNATEVANGMTNSNPKFGKANGNLYLFWEEFLSPEGKVIPINCNGMKWEEETGKWNPLGTLLQCPMKESPFLNLNYYYSQSIHDDGVDVIWKEGEEYRKKSAPLL